MKEFGNRRMEQLQENGWTRKNYLAIPNFEFEVSEIEQAEIYLAESAIDQHHFFKMAGEEALCLQLWAEQELVVSSVFSQILAEWIGRIDNCYIRRMLLPVFVGEHGEDPHGAAGAHPVLAESMCASLGSRLDRIKPLPMTIRFVAELEEAASDPMYGAGFLGIGNERMLIPEYTAAMRCFENVLPGVAYKAFLTANIEEDASHNVLIERAACALASLGYDGAAFLEGARMGVDSRVRYFSELQLLCEDMSALQLSLSIS